MGGGGVEKNKNLPKWGGGGGGRKFSKINGGRGVGQAGG